MFFSSIPKIRMENIGISSLYCTNHGCHSRNSAPWNSVQQAALCTCWRHTAPLHKRTNRKCINTILVLHFWVTFLLHKTAKQIDFGGSIKRFRTRRSWHEKLYRNFTKVERKHTKFQVKVDEATKQFSHVLTDLWLTFRIVGRHCVIQVNDLQQI